MMNKIVRLLAMLGLIAVLAGCAGPVAMVKDESPVSRNPNEATIVFMRSSFVGSAISASVFDVSRDSTKFIGIIQNGTKIAYSVPPGEHVFMVVSEAADFMKATVVPNKTYYALVTPRMGTWVARFSFRPLRQGDFSSEDFAKWDSNTQLMRSSPEAVAWAQKNASDVDAKRAKYWPEWQSKEQLQRDSQTLNPQDGR